MNTSVLKSAGAVAAGFVASVVLTMGTDTVLEQTGVLPLGPHDKLGLHLLEVAYRCVFTVFGGYLAARLAPNRPTRHALAVGVVGLIINVVGAVATWDMNLAPAWFTTSLVLLALPLAWLGGTLRPTR